MNGAQTGSVTYGVICESRQPFPTNLPGLVDFSNSSGNTALSVHPSKGSGFSMAWKEWSTLGGWDSTSHSVVGDFDNDGRDDVATAWNNGGTVAIALRNSTGSSFGHDGTDTTGGWMASTRWVAGNFDGVGGDEIAGIWAGGTSSNPQTMIAIYKWIGSDFVAIQNVPSSGWVDGAQWLAGDFDGDGRDDIVGIWNNSGANQFSVRTSTSGGGTFGFSVRHWLTSGTWSDTTKWLAGNFDGQNGVDIVAVRNKNPGTSSTATELLMYKSTPTLSVPVFQLQPPWQTTLGWDSTSQWTTADYDGDGKTDVAAIWNNVGNIRTVAMRRSTGAAFTHETWLPNAGPWNASSKWMSGKFF